MKKCNSNFETKNHEALLIKKHNPGPMVDIQIQGPRQEFPKIDVL